MEPQGFIPDPEGFVEEVQPSTLSSIPQPLSGIEDIPILGKPLSTLRNLGQDIGTSLGLMATQESPESLKQKEDVKSQLNQMIMNETDPEKKRRMMSVLLSSETPPDLTQSFSPDMEKSRSRRVGEVMLSGGEIALAGNAVDSAYGLVKNPAKEGLKFVSNPRKYWGEARKVAAESYKDVAIKTDDLWKAGERVRQTIDTKTGDKATKIATERLVGKQFTPQQLLDKMQIWKDAYNQAGKVGKTEKAKVYQALYEEGNNLLRKNAPKVAEYTSKLAKTYSVPKAVKSLIKLSTIPAALYGASKFIPK